MPNLNSICKPTDRSGLFCCRERFADPDHAARFAAMADAMKIFRVIERGQEPDGAYYVDVLQYSTYAFPDGKYSDPS